VDEDGELHSYGGLRILECPEEIEVKLKIPGNRMMMSKRLIRKKKIVPETYTWIGRSADSMEKYKITKKTAKRAVSEARGQKYDYEGLYQRLDTKEGKRYIHMRDVEQVKCIKNGAD
jgi:hypothetical protein